MVASLQELIDEYKSRHGELTEKDRAIFERRIWSLVEDKKNHAKERLGGILGVGNYEVNSRSSLLTTGDAGDILWDRVQGDMSLRTAVNIATIAKRRMANDGISLNDAIVQALEEYDSRPIVQILGDGKVIRKGEPELKRPKRVSSRPSPQSRPEAEPESEPEEPEVMSSFSEDSFFVDLRDGISSYIDSRTRGMVGPDVDALKKDLEGEVKTLIGSFRSRLQNFVSRGKRRISFKEVLEACTALMLEPPIPGELPDMDEATKMFRRLAKAYHPDTGGGEHTKEQYQAVVKASALLKDYQRQVEMDVEKGKPRGSQWGKR